MKDWSESNQPRSYGSRILVLSVGLEAMRCTSQSQQLLYVCLPFPHSSTLVLVLVRGAPAMQTKMHARIKNN